MKKRQRRIAALLLACAVASVPVSQAFAETTYDVVFPPFSAIRAVLTPIRAEFLLFLPSLWYIYSNETPV